MKILPRLINNDLMCITIQTCLKVTSPPLFGFNSLKALFVLQSCVSSSHCRDTNSFLNRSITYKRHSSPLLFWNTCYFGSLLVRKSDSFCKLISFCFITISISLEETFMWCVSSVSTMVVDLFVLLAFTEKFLIFFLFLWDYIPI